MARFRAVALLACAMLLAGGTGVLAQLRSNTPRIFLSGQSYHMALCAGPALPGHRRCFAHVVTDRTGRRLTNRFVPNRLEPAARSNLVPAGFGPHSLILAYNPAVASHYPVGVGSSKTIIAIVDAFGYVNAERDLQVYRSTFGLPTCTTANGCFTKYNQNGVQGSYPIQDVGWAGETALDLDMASAMCPNCKIILVEANNDQSGSLAAAVNTAAAKGAHVISNSYGGPEGGPGPDFNSSYNHPGVAVTASAGDNGYDDQQSSPQGAESPATSQFVTAVGGTSLRQAPGTTRGWTESAWVDGGSGCSIYYPKPIWQASITLCTKRMETDVSAVGDPDTGVAVYQPDTLTSSSWAIYGGTSVGAPLIGGLYGANGGTVFLGNLYKSFVKLNDVTTGSNGTCGGTYFCNARKGYDGPTGLGTPTSEVGF
jgi:hypothetical protein